MSDRRRIRHQATRDEVLAAAWLLAERDGIAGLSLREVATTVGMRAPSLYTYFDSKDALYDAMFEEGNRALIATVTEFDETAEALDTVEAMTMGLERWIEFCQASVARYQLLFTNAVPGWRPSPDSYAVAEEAYEAMRLALGRWGIDSQDDLDLYTAISAGLAAQQMANDPTGDRWRRLSRRAVLMFTEALERSAP